MTNNLAWEITLDDVQVVADQHDVKLDDDRAQELCNRLDHDAIINGLLDYCDFDDQVESMCDDIEDRLLEWNVVSGNKVYRGPK